MKDIQASTPETYDPVDLTANPDPSTNLEESISKRTHSQVSSTIPLVSSKPKRKQSQMSTQVTPDPEFNYPGPNPFTKKSIWDDPETGASNIVKDKSQKKDKNDSDQPDSPKKTTNKRKKYMKLRNKPSPCYFLG